MSTAKGKVMREGLTSAGEWLEGDEPHDEALLEEADWSRAESEWLHAAEAQTFLATRISKDGGHPFDAPDVYDSPEAMDSPLDYDTREAMQEVQLCLPGMAQPV